MRRIHLLNSITNEYDPFNCYLVDDVKQSQFPSGKVTKSEKKGNCNQVFGAFDIETTTITDGFKNPIGFMYHWQFAIYNGSQMLIVYGRRWEEFTKLLNLLQDFYNTNKQRFVIYVHNLGYEYQFIKDLIGDHKVFASKPHKPMSVRCESGIEFRCSWFNTNMTLEKACKNEKGCVHLKAVGDLDYRIKRTPNTTLDNNEFRYCIADVVSLAELIYNRLRNNKDTLNSIPLTSTGYVRREVREACKKDRRYRPNVFLKQRIDETIYTLLKEAGRGADTHANRFLSGHILEGLDSYDVQSSYPYALVTQKFPMSKFQYYGEIDSEDEFYNLIDTRACLFRIAFTDIHIKPDCITPYIPVSKSTALKPSVDNGRILESEYLEMTLTDIDFRLIEQCYDFAEFTVSDMYTAKYGYLPECFRKAVMQYYQTKCELKYNIEHGIGDETNNRYLYAKQKNRLNGCFGMAYTDPCRETVEIDFENGEWSVTPPTIADALEKFYNSRNSFLVYAWGVWCTARGREHLYKLINICKSSHDNTGAPAYWDTDSCKGQNFDDDLIQQENEKIKRICEKTGGYADVNGERFYLGVYEHENKKPIEKFITLGAKKYAYVDEKGLHVTVSGVPKETGAKELGSIENFKIGFIFKQAGMTLYYNQDTIHQITVDDCTFTTASNIGMVESTYTITTTETYAQLIGKEEELAQWKNEKKKIDS